MHLPYSSSCSSCSAGSTVETSHVPHVSAASASRTLTATALQGSRWASWGGMSSCYLPSMRFRYDPLPQYQPGRGYDCFDCCGSRTCGSPSLPLPHHHRHHYHHPQSLNAYRHGCYPLQKSLALCFRQRALALCVHSTYLAAKRLYGLLQPTS